tara:strand:+ start:24416 stop:24769 length:354 start_codon:yes stop_codon:yes gene_type:complete
MGFDIGDFVNGMVDSILESPSILWIASNPIITALVITIVLCFIILIVFRDAETEESLPVITLRAGFWMFMAITGVMLVHNKVLSANASEKIKLKNSAALMDTQYHPREEVVPVPERK